MLVHFVTFFLILLNLPDASPNDPSDGMGYLFKPRYIWFTGAMVTILQTIETVCTMGLPSYVIGIYHLILCQLCELYHPICCTMLRITISCITIPSSYHCSLYHSVPYLTIPHITITYITMPYHYHSIPHFTILYVPPPLTCITIPYLLSYHTTPIILYHTSPYHATRYHTIPDNIIYHTASHHIACHHTSLYPNTIPHQDTIDPLPLFQTFCNLLNHSPS